MPIHVGLNLAFLVPGETGGMEVYARELLPELARAAPDHRFTAFVSREAAASGGPWRDLHACVVLPVDARSRVQRVRAEQLLLPRLARRAQVDLLHSLASTAPAHGAYRTVVTIHDLIYRLVPQTHPGLRSVGLRLLVPLAAHRSDRIIVDAASTRADLERFLHIPPDRVDVVPLGLGSVRRVPPLPEDRLRRRLGAGERPIVLSVSAKLAHKNLMRLIGALALIPAHERPLLVLPGYSTPHEDELRDRAVQLGLDDDVRLLGWVDAEELESLYAHAVCFVFPSLAEGFGLPVLEAMARGVPVACSGRGAVGEVAGAAALRFDPESEPAIAAAIRRLMSDPAEARRLVEAGRRRAAQFSWRATATGTLAAYDRALETPARRRGALAGRAALRSRARTR